MFDEVCNYFASSGGFSSAHCFVIHQELACLLPA
jgi:hypothetical protein